MRVPSQTVTSSILCVLRDQNLHLVHDANHVAVPSIPAYFSTLLGKSGVAWVGSRHLDTCPLTVEHMFSPILGFIFSEPYDELGSKLPSAQHFF